MVEVVVGVVGRLEGVEGKRGDDAEGDRARLGRDWERGGDWRGGLGRDWEMGGN